MDWNDIASIKLREHLVRKKISYKMLSALLEDIGINETERAIQGKLALGRQSDRP